ncbi:hypothetical protein MTO96_029061 [Rhipicephalus appendiculatus]
MLKFTLLLLLCTAVISSATPDLFRGCVPRSVNRTARNRCIMIPEGELRLNRTYYMLLAEEVLQKSSNQLHKRFLNTVYKITRAATQENGSSRDHKFILLPRRCYVGRETIYALAALERSVKGQQAHNASHYAIAGTPCGPQ